MENVVPQPAVEDDPAVFPVPATPEAQEWLDAVRRDEADGSLWRTPSIRQQLGGHYRRVGLPD